MYEELIVKMRKKKVGGGGVWVQGARFDPKPSQVGEIDKKKSEKKNCALSGI